MLNLTKAIWAELSGSALSAHIGNRMYKGQAPEGTDYPYCVYMVVSDTPDNVFDGYYEDVLVQFSLFSITSGTTEIENCYTDLKTLYDEKSFSITGSTLITMKRIQANFIVEDHVTPTGTQRVWAYHCDFQVLTNLD